MFFMILIGIFAGFFVRILFPGLNTIAYVGIKLLILPLVMGLGYEIIRLAGKHDNVVTRALSAPGLWVQRITTKEPTDEMLEVAIISLKCALRDEFSEFMDFYNSRPWDIAAEQLEKMPEESEASTEEAAISESSVENGNRETLDAVEQPSEKSAEE